MRRGLHDDFGRHIEVRGSSDRSFGLWFTLFFVVIGLLPLRHSRPVKIWALAVAAVFLLLAFAAPQILRPLNQAWTKLGLVLGKIVNPIVMSVVFLLLVTPLALLFRVLGKDPLRLRLAPDATTYWLPRDPPGPAPETMARQF